VSVPFFASLFKSYRPGLDLVNAPPTELNGTDALHK
jgi:hypothetical protein